MTKIEIRDMPWSTECDCIEIKITFPNDEQTQPQDTLKIQEFSSYLTFYAKEDTIYIKTEYSLVYMDLRYL